jgi:hypothetical protein
MTMSPSAIAGIVVMLVGGLMIGDYKGLGMSNPAVGILVTGGGFLLTCYGFFAGHSSANEGGRGKRVKDYSI